MKDRAMLFDRDGTLIVDHPGNTDPNSVELMPHAADALALARESGWMLGIVTNQPALANGSLDEAQLLALHARIDAIAGPFDGWFVCIHGAADACKCRKPQPGLILRASQRFGISTDRCVVIGDIGTDLEAAHAAGARGVLVPTPVTRREEIEAAPVVATDVLDAVRRIVAGDV